MTPLSDREAFFGKYVKKQERAVPLKTSRIIEQLYYKECGKNRVAQGEIDRAHRELDNLGIARFQDNTNFLLSLSGRIRKIKNQ
jgi:hypothetical protein